jgi:carbamoyl-phosphate synthase large subunit
MTSCNILITSAGRRVSLVELFQKAIIQLDIKGKVFAVDLQEHAPALQVADDSQTVMRVTDENYINQLLEICKINDINLIVPTIDTELSILSAASDLLSQNNIKVLVCDNDINHIFMDKRRAQSFFESNNIPTPRLYSTEESIELTNDKYPLLLKPANGSCSIGVTKVYNKKELIFFLDYLDDPIVQEFIQGDEYTIDVLVDFLGKVQCAVPRLRIETRAGEVSKAITINDKDIIDWSYRVTELMSGVIGCVTLQCFKQKNGELKFIEINPRFGGGFPLTAAAGANYPLWILQMLGDQPVQGDMQAQWQDNFAMLRFDQGLFVKAASVGL